MIFLKLFFEFFKTGLFSVGGGYATMPFLYQISNDYNWYSLQELADILAISVITPGPVGVNMATFAGFKTSGILGAIVATLALVLPSYFIVIMVSKLIKKFEKNFYVESILYGLKPTGCGLLLAVAVNFFKNNVKDLYALLFFIFLFILSFKFKKNPLFYFLIGGIFGLAVNFFGLIIK
ncbi:MAG: chromate transporter [Cyanobacteria bacterium SIG30]|nr:chromate transporter [Cyanobacteria bacterium SIG30]